MASIIGKRILREWKRNWVRYTTLFFVITASVYAILSVIAAAQTIISGVKENGEACQVEDGQIILQTAMPEQLWEEVEKHGVLLEAMPYRDCDGEDDSEVRIYQNRQQINLLTLVAGESADEADEIVLERHYARLHDYDPGDTITLGGVTLTVTGVGVTPDYDGVFRNLTDTTAQSYLFGNGFVTEETYEKIGQATAGVKAENYTYAYHFTEETEEKRWDSDDLQTYFGEQTLDGQTPLLVQLLEKEDNRRIGTSAEDVQPYRSAGLIIGTIVLILLIYVISVFVKESAERDRGIIGSLYSLGVSKWEVIAQYLLPPVLVTLAASVLGTRLGLSKYGMGLQMKGLTDYFSTPDFPSEYAPYLYLYGLVAPTLVCVLVNVYTLHRQLSCPVLQLLRKEQTAKVKGGIRLGRLGFIRMFQFRLFLREIRTSIIAILGILFSTLVMMAAGDVYWACTNFRTQSRQDVQFEYMYTYRQPEMSFVQTEQGIETVYQVPEGGEAATLQFLKKEIYGISIDITLLGVSKDTRYFQMEDLTTSQDQVVISTALAKKFHVDVGETVTFTNRAKDTTYSFEVVGITPYGAGNYAFMENQAMKELFDWEEGYYNVVFSDQALEIPDMLLYSTTTRGDLIRNSDIFLRVMTGLIVLIGTVSIFVFALVMYLMIKVMLDASQSSISLVKVFGFQNTEIRKMYMNGKRFMIVVGCAVSIVIDKRIFDSLFPHMVANVDIGLDVTFPLSMYVLLFAGMVGIYLLVQEILWQRIRKISCAAIIQGRE